MALRTERPIRVGDAFAFQYLQIFGVVLLPNSNEPGLSLVQVTTGRIMYAPHLDILNGRREVEALMAEN